MNTHMFSFLLLLSLSTGTMSSGVMKLEIIPPTSPDSPFYVGHLSFSKMIQVSVQQSNDRDSYYASMKNTHAQNRLNTLPSPQLYHQKSAGLYAARLWIGTSPPIPYLLALDTASNVIWLQCIECRQVGNTCFHQEGRYRQLQGPFVCDKPHSCNPINCTYDRRICHQKGGSCKGSYCLYQLEFFDNSKTKGYFAQGKFTFDGNSRENFVQKQLYFGCGINQTGFVDFDNQNSMAGIMGMSFAPNSLPRQLEADGNMSKFSHCLPSEEGPPTSSFLSFGPDIPTDGFSKAQLHRLAPPHEAMYSVVLTGISIDDDEIIKDLNTFAIIDTGTKLTRLDKHVHKRLLRKLVNHFSDPNLNIKRTAIHPDLLCYKRLIAPRYPYDNLPIITLNLGKAKFEIMPAAAFIVHHHININMHEFCLWMIAGDQTLIGARALTNHRIVYDPWTSQLHFKPETC